MEVKLKHNHYEILNEISMSHGLSKASETSRELFELMKENTIFNHHKYDEIIELITRRPELKDKIYFSNSWCLVSYYENGVINDFYIKLGLVHLPAMLFMAALAVVLIGFLPGLTGLVWLYLGYSFFVVYMGEMLKLPNWLEKLSPFGHIPQLPLEGADIARLSIMAGLAIALIVAGFIGYRQRDIQG